MSNDIQTKDDIADLVRRVRIGLDEVEWALRRYGVPGLRQEETPRRLRLFASGLVDVADGLEASLNGG